MSESNVENNVEFKSVPPVDEPVLLFPVEEEQLVKPGTGTNSKNLPVDPKLLKPGKINDKSMLARMYEAGFTHEEIADHFGVSREAVTRMVSRMDLVRETANPALFQEKLNEEILIRMENLLRYMTPEKMNKASLSQIIIAFGTLYDKMRLQRGESTANVANLNIHAFEGEDLEKIKEVIKKRTQEKLKKIQKEYDS